MSPVRNKSRGAITLGMVIAVVIIAVILIVTLIVLWPVFKGEKGVSPSQSVLFRSEDGANTWKPLEKFPGGEILTLDFDARDPSTLLVGTRRRGLWQGKTSGEEWRQFPGGLGGNSQIFDLLDLPTAEKLIALVLFSNRGRVIKLEEDTRTELLFTPLERFAYFQGDLTPDGKLRVIGSDGGFYESRNQGATWRSLARFQEGLALMAVNSANAGEIWVLDSRGSLFYSQSGGISWKDLTDGLKNFQGAMEAEVILFEPRAGLLYHGSRHGLLKSSDRGRSWERVNLTLAPEVLPVSALAADPSDPNKLIVGAQGQLYISQDGGISWRGIQLASSGSIAAILFDPKNSNNVFIGLKTGQRLR